MKGLSSFTADKGFMVRIIGTDLSTRDISGAKDSFSELTEFLTRFPDSQYAPYANQRIVYLRNLIASGELAAADYYVKRKAYVAAIRRANYVIENIPNSSETLRALKILSLSYQALGYSELYEDTQNIIALNASKFEKYSSQNDTWSWKSIIGMSPSSGS
jgi:outer membrane protein assembly factor BamD